jgi:hypothetical protein
LQEFKCHSLILISAVSPYFKKLLEGVDFKGPKSGRDDPIVLDKFEPEVFWSEMMFVGVMLYISMALFL